MIDKFVIIVGAMKSGTTSLFEYLAQHPEICPAKDKEPEFFVRQKKLEQGMDEYEKLWDWDSSKHKYALEASTSYTKMPVFSDAAENIKQSNRDFKFIYIIRDPISRIASQLGHTAIVENERHKEMSATTLNNSIQYSSYYSQINEYVKRFGKESILLLQFEDFILDPVAVSATVSEFLEISKEYDYKLLKPKNEKYDVMLSTKFKKLVTLRRYIPENVWKNIKNFILSNNAFRHYMNKNMVQNSSLDETAKYTIKKKLIKDITELQNNFNIDTSKWQEWNSIIL